MRSPSALLLGRLLQAGDQRGGQRADPQPAQHLVDPAEDVRGLLLPVVGDAAQDAADLPHRGRGVDVVADHVADHQQRRAVGLLERVVPVAADVHVAAAGW